MMTVMRMRSGTGAINFVVALGGRVDESRLRRAVRLAMDAEPILGCRFVEHGGRPYWQRRDDLDSLDLVQVVHDPAAGRFEQSLGESIDPEREPLLRTIVFRSDRDTVCFKIAHAIADAKAYFNVIGLVTKIYNRLRDEPDYRPVVNGARRLSQREISRQLSPRQRFKLLRTVVASRMRRPARHRLPGPSGSPFGGYVVLRLRAERFSQLRSHARERQLTITSLLLAAIFRAMRDVFPVEGTGEVAFVTTADLRRYLADASAEGQIANLFGTLVLSLPAEQTGDLDDTAAKVHAQLSAVAKDPTAIGGAQAVLFALPPLAWCIHRLPFTLLKRRVSKLARRVGDGDQLHWSVGNVGTISPEMVRFGDLAVEDAYLLGPMVFAPGLVMAFSTFTGALTLSLGVSNRSIDEASLRTLFAAIDRELPYGDTMPGQVQMLKVETSHLDGKQDGGKELRTVGAGSP